MKVNVLLNTNTLTLDGVDAARTVESIKDLIFEKFRDVSAPIPDNPLVHTYLTTNHLRLLYKGKQLPKLSTLQDHSFKDDDTVLLFVSQKQQEDPQDDKNEMVHTTVGNKEKNLKYTLTIKNNHRLQGDAPDAELLEVLGQDELQKLLQRLPYDIPTDAALEVPLKFDRSKAIPAKAMKLSTTFPSNANGTLNKPASVAPPPTRMLPLTVEEYSPSTRMFMDTPIRVKFSQPMVPLDEYEKVQNTFPVPIKMTPTVEGDWTWCDPYTAVFTSKAPYPKSTEFFLAVRGGITSAVGGTMRDPVEWSFSTAPLSIANRRMSFGGPRIQGLIQFNQHVDVDTIFKSLIVTSGDEIYDCTLLSASSPKLHHELKKMLNEAKEDRKERECFVFEIDDDVNGIGKKGNKPIEVEVTISPTYLNLEKQLSFKFKTVGAFEVKPVTRYDAKGKPIVWLMSGTLSVTFTNPMLPNLPPSFLQKCVTVVPEIPNMKVSGFEASLSIAGEKLPGREYAVTILTDLMDIHGQNLEKQTTVTFPVTAPTTAYLDISKQGGGYGFWGSPVHSSLTTLDPHLPPVIHFTTRNVRSVRVRAYAVGPVQHYNAFAEFLGKKERVYPNFLHEVFNTTIELVPPKEQDGNVAWYRDSHTAIDLSKAFGADDSRVCGKSKESQLVVIVVATDTVSFSLENQVCKKMWLTWSDVGIAYAADEENIYGWTFSLTTGEPLKCNMYLCDGDEALPLEENKQDSVGGAFVTAKNKLAKPKYSFLAAEIGQRSAIVSIPDGLFTKSPKYKHVWHVIDDRRKYRPFDKVYIKGIIRHIDYTKHKLTLPTEALNKLEYTVVDSRSKTAINTTKVEMKDSYCFDFEFEIPGTINLGHTTINLKWGEAIHSHSVDVQEYKRKAFEMELSKDKTTLRPQEALSLTAFAKGFTGEILSGTTATWKVSVVPAHYAPPNMGKYTFGIKASGDEDRYSWESEKNHSGKHTIAVSIDHILIPVVVSVNCTVKDTTNEELSAHDRIVVHPCDVYVGMNSEQQFVNFGEPYTFYAVTVDSAGKFTGNCSLHMYARGVPFETYDGENLPSDIAVVDTPLTPSDAGPIEFKFEPKFRGKHLLTLVCTDLNGRTSKTDTEFWVYGTQTPAEKEYQEVKQKEKNNPKSPEPLPHHLFNSSLLELVWDKKEALYEPGNTAELLIVAPFWPAQGVYYIHKNNTIIAMEKFTAIDSMTRLPIKVLDEFLPNAKVEVVLTGIEHRTKAVETTEGAEPELKKKRTENSEIANLMKPAHASGSTTLKVDYEHKKLSLRVAPSQVRDSPYLPGDEVSMDVEVFGASGQPVNGAEVTLVAVDEAILALTGYSLEDPRTILYGAQSSNVYCSTTHKNLMLTRVIPKTAVPPPVVPDEGFITICYFSGRVLRFEVSNTLPILKLKALIQERDGLPPPTQRLLYKGKQLTDEGTLADQGVPKGATINLVLRLFGGGVDDGDDKNLLMNPAPVIRIRTNMNALAHFGPNLKTGINGKATATFVLPDSLTRYRVMAMANTIDQFGAGETSIIASLPLMIRQAPPRFLNFGDTCVLPVMVQNELDHEAELVVGMRGLNVDIQTPGYKLKIPGHGRSSVPFNVTPKGPGSAVFQVAVSDSKLTHSDAAQFKFPIHTPTTTETVANTGVIDGDNVVQQPIARFTNENVVATSGGLEVSFASTIFQELTDAALYLINYPYECSEQLSSKIISFVAFKEMLPLLHRSRKVNSEENPIPTSQSISARVKTMIDTLVDRKDSSGNFGYWSKGSKAYDYVSVYSYMALNFAKSNGFDVPASVTASAQSFLKTIITKYSRESTKQQKSDKQDSSRTLRWLRRNVSTSSDDEDELEPDHGLACYTMYVLNTVAPGGKIEQATTMLNRKKLEKMPLEQVAMLIPTILDNKATLKSSQRKVWDYITSSAVQTNSTAHFTDAHTNSLFLRSDIRQDAIILESLLRGDPKHPLIIKLVRGLLARKNNGMWFNTQDNSFALIAMHKYFVAHEKDFGNYVVDLWVGSGHAGRTEFNGQSTDTHVTEVLMQYLIDEKDSSVTISKRGQGRMYYRIAVEYSPTALFLPSRSCGFKLTRVYSPVLEEKDVLLETDETGNKRYMIKAGSAINIKVTMSTEALHEHVALVDYLPGGLEPQHGNAGASGTHTGYSYVRRFWNHQNIRDSRVEVFVDMLYPGMYTYSYKVRAITKGKFLVPPAKAEEMYSPDVFGRSDMMVVHVI